MADEEVRSCRDYDDVTEAAFDGMITFVRLLKGRDLSSERIQGAMEDFFTDPELAAIRDAWTTRQPDETESPAKVETATPEEYRAMLDRLGIFTRATENGFEAADFRVVRDSGGRWEIISLDGTSLFVSDQAGKAAETFLTRILPR